MKGFPKANRACAPCGFHEDVTVLWALGSATRTIPNPSSQCPIGSFQIQHLNESALAWLPLSSMHLKIWASQPSACRTSRDALDDNWYKKLDTASVGHQLEVVSVQQGCCKHGWSCCRN